MKSLNLDTLLGQRHEHATFHDSELQSIQFDITSGSAKLEFLIPCGLLPGNELSHQPGTLEFTGLLFYFVEPSLLSSQANDKPSLWITSDGALPDEEVDLAIELPRDLPQEAFAHYFYSSTTNSFIVICAMQGAFHWHELKQISPA